VEAVRHEDGLSAAPVAKSHRTVRPHHLHLRHARHHHKAKLNANSLISRQIHG
jgi:hypothetical protein